jgi:hypothetical protein
MACICIAAPTSSLYRIEPIAPTNATPCHELRRIADRTLSPIMIGAKMDRDLPLSTTRAVEQSSANPQIMKRLNDRLR